MSTIFAATTYDSASYTLASSSTLRLRAGDNPARWFRVFWAFALAVMPITLVYIMRDTANAGTGLQAMLLIASLPILVVGVFMTVSLMRQLQSDHD